MKKSTTPIITTLVLLITGQFTLSAQAIYYSEYGASGDGVTDDFDAIISAHAAANEAGLKVRADAGATYYIGAARKTAQVQTRKIEVFRGSFK